MFKISAIEQALKEGCRLRTFRSGGGLRVVRIEDQNNELKGYGEHPAIEDALSHSNQDILDGHLAYKEQYGENGKYAHYVTGRSESSTELDAWINQGHNFNARYDGAEQHFVVDLIGYTDGKIPTQVEYIKTGVSNVSIWEALVNAHAANPVELVE